jgi:hypothetical protein
MLGKPPLRMGWTGRAPAPNDTQSLLGAFEEHEEHAMPSKADTAIARTIGIDTGKNTQLPGPPPSPVRTGVSWSLTNSPQFAGVSAVQIPRMRSLPRMKTARRWFGAFRLWRPKSVSRCAEKAAARDSVRMRQRPVCIQEIGEELDWDMVGRLPPG